MTLLPKKTLEWMLKVKYSYNFLTKSSKEMGLKRFLSQNFSLFIVKFKKLGFSATLSNCDVQCVLPDQNIA